MKMCGIIPVCVLDVASLGVGWRYLKGEMCDEERNTDDRVQAVVA